MAEAGITEGELVNFVLAKGYQEGSTSITDYPDSFVTGWVLKYWNQILASIDDASKNNI